MCDYDGGNRRVVLSDMMPHPFGLTLLGDYLYWTDWHEHVVQRADKVSSKERLADDRLRESRG